MAKTAELLEQLVSRLDALEQKIDKKPEVQPEVKEEHPEVPESSDALNIALDGPSEPVPPEYRGIVDQVLNKSFGIHVKSDIGRFKFTILVPEKYSSLSSGQRQIMKFDMRPRVITFAEGPNGVRLWCEKVFNNFDPSMQAIIVSDRIANP